ncbi:MAG: MmcQ/YjbR family DNA-binding protein [[Pasteurella] aerogenes]|nr:MmcQ/YjbR family DNA-binding protein [[Pasteurella] aerogenes]
MNATHFTIQIQQRYDIKAEYPWAKFPDYAIFRHAHHRKWFALLMNITANKIGLASKDEINIVNLKAKPEEVGSLRRIKGIYPAYHMNKEHWISVHLGEIEETLLWELLDESFYLTVKK